MVRIPRGLNATAGSGPGGPGSQAVRRLTPTNIFAYGRKVTGIPLTGGQAQIVLQATGQQLPLTIQRGPSSNLLQAGNGGTLTWTVNPAAGSKILVAVWTLTSEVMNPVTDNGVSPSTFTQDYTASVVGLTLRIFRADNISLPATGSYQVSVTGTGGHAVIAAGSGYVNVAGGPPTGTDNNTGTSTSVTTGTVTPARAGALYFAAFTDDTALASEVITLTASGFVSRFSQPNGAASIAGAVADKIDAGGPTATQCTWTLGDSVDWVGAIAVYDAATSSPATGQVSVTPQGLGTVWYPAQATVSTTTGVLDGSTFNLYLGPAGVPITLVGTLFPGGAGTLALAIPPMSPGQALIGIWTNGHAGDLASLNVIGVMDAATT